MLALDNVVFVIHADQIHLHHREATHDIVDFMKDRLRSAFGHAAVVFTPPEEVGRLNGATTVVELSTYSPMMDLNLVERSIEIAKEKGCEVIIEGAVPGTAPRRVYCVDGTERGRTHRLLWGTQRQYNAQLNIRKLKRVKLFFYFLSTYENLAQKPVEEFLHYLGTPGGVRSVLSYGANIRLTELSACPLCKSEDLYRLHHDTGQPMIGFLTKESEYYSLCGDCDLVFLNPTVHPEDVGLLYDWYDSEGAGPPTESLYSDEQLRAHSTYENFKLFLDDCAPKMAANSKLLDLGGGSGSFAVMVKARHPDWDVTMMDFRADDVRPLLRSRGVECLNGNFLELELDLNAYDVITMWEVVEHLPIDALQAFWARIYRALKPGGYLVLSTPDYFSPYTQSQDYWACFVPQHLTVLSKRVLERLWMSAGFELFQLHYVNSLFREVASYYAYGADNNASVGARGDAGALNHLLMNRPVLRAQKQWMRENKYGAEMILLLQKPT